MLALTVLAPWSLVNQMSLPAQSPAPLSPIILSQVSSVTTVGCGYVELPNRRGSMSLGILLRLSLDPEAAGENQWISGSPPRPPVLF